MSVSESRDAVLLREQLQQIADIEKNHDFLGVRFSLRDAARNSQVNTEDVAEHVLHILNRTVLLSQSVEEIPFSPPYPPEAVRQSEFQSKIDF